MKDITLLQPKQEKNGQNIMKMFHLDRHCSALAIRGLAVFPHRHGR
jgi:hypothetical protein